MRLRGLPPHRTTQKIGFHNMTGGPVARSEQPARFREIRGTAVDGESAAMLFFETPRQCSFSGSRGYRPRNSMRRNVGAFRPA